MLITENTENTAPKPIEKMTKQELQDRVRQLEERVEAQSAEQRADRHHLNRRIESLDGQLRVHERYLSLFEAKRGTEVPF